MSNLTLDVGLAAKLKVAFARNGWTEQLIDSACEGDKLGQFKQVLLGHASITVVSHVIDCDAEPYLPDDWTVEEHQKGGSWKWDASQVDLYNVRGQKAKGGKYIECDKARKDLAKKVSFNANVLDYLLANPHLIPEKWKRRHVYFWGTVYRGIGSNLYVRYLCWTSRGWQSMSCLVDSDWYGQRTAAVRAS